MATSTQDPRPQLSAVYFLKPEVEGCHSVFNRSSQFIFSNITSDKLEP